MIIGEKSWSQVIGNPLQRLPYIHVKAKHALHSASTSIRHAFTAVGASAGAWSRRLCLFLFLELALLLFLHFYMLVPVIYLVIPMVAFDYLFVVGMILYLRLMVSSLSTFEM
jgi:hypothetical protein